MKQTLLWIYLSIWYKWLRCIKYFALDLWDEKTVRILMSLEFYWRNNQRKHMEILEQKFLNRLHPHESPPTYLEELHFSTFSIFRWFSQIRVKSQISKVLFTRISPMFNFFAGPACASLLPNCLSYVPILFLCFPSSLRDCGRTEGERLSPATVTHQLFGCFRQKKDDKSDRNLGSSVSRPPIQTSECDPVVPSPRLPIR